MIDSGMETKASGRPPIRGTPAKCKNKRKKKNRSCIYVDVYGLVNFLVCPWEEKGCACKW